MKELREIATKVRAAIIAAAKVEKHESFDGYPVGSCRAASHILGTYLEENGYGQWEIVSGEREDDYTHAWLMQGSTIIDITASQFEGMVEDVVCCGIGSKWHKQFRDIEAAPANLWLSEETASLPLGPFYQVVCQILAARVGVGG